MTGLAIFLEKIGWLSPDLFQLFFEYNLMIFLFNLFPIWPLDGGKLVFLLLSLKRPFPEAHRLTLLMSTGFLTLFAILILITAPTHINVWVVIFFLYFSLYHEWKQRRYVFMRFLLERYYGKVDGPHNLVPIKAGEEETIIQVLQRFQRGCKHPIIIEGIDNEERMLDENEVLHAYFTEKRITDKISDLLFSY
jgi:stage IV sporulation protein FB